MSSRFLFSRKPSMPMMRARAANLVGEWWVDDDCKWRPVVINSGNGSSSLLIGSSVMDQNIALRLLSMARIKITKDTVHIRWDVKAVNQQTMSDILNYLGEVKSKKILLNFFFGGWTTEEYFSSNQAIMRILALQRLQETYPISTVYIEGHDVKDKHKKTKLLRRGSDFLHTIKNGFDNISDNQLAGFLPHNLVFGKNNPDAPVTFSYIGSKSTSALIYGQDWSINSIDAISDKTLSESNQEFDSRVSSSYDEVLRSGEPRLDHIRALIHLENAEPIWVSYQRLLYKVKASNGKETVFCLCDRTQHLSMDFLIPLKSD